MNFFRPSWDPEWEEDDREDGGQYSTEAVPAKEWVDMQEKWIHV